jgi:hypothetical protein
LITLHENLAEVGLEKVASKFLSRIRNARKQVLTQHPVSSNAQNGPFRTARSASRSRRIPGPGRVLESLPEVYSVRRSVIAGSIVASSTMRSAGGGSTAAARS